MYKLKKTLYTQCIPGRGWGSEGSKREMGREGVVLFLENVSEVNKIVKGELKTLTGLEPSIRYRI